VIRREPGEQGIPRADSSRLPLLPDARYSEKPARAGKVTSPPHEAATSRPDGPARPQNLSHHRGHHRGQRADASMTGPVHDKSKAPGWPPASTAVRSGYNHPPPCCSPREPGHHRCSGPLAGVRIQRPCRRLHHRRRSPSLDRQHVTCPRRPPSHMETVQPQTAHKIVQGSPPPSSSPWSPQARAPLPFRPNGRQLSLHTRELPLSPPAGRAPDSHHPLETTDNIRPGWNAPCGRPTQCHPASAEPATSGLPKTL